LTINTNTEGQNKRCRNMRPAKKELN